VIQAIKSKVGCSIVSSSAIQEEVTNGVFKSVKIEDIKFPGDFYLIMQRRKARSAICEVFAGCIKNNSLPS
jgi:DNA-binding transcriptional LysR family regulator